MFDHDHHREQQQSIHLVHALMMAMITEQSIARARLPQTDWRVMMAIRGVGLQQQQHHGAREHIKCCRWCSFSICS